MSPAAWTFLGVVVSSVIVLLVALGGNFTARGNRKASPYGEVVDRVVQLEEQRKQDRAEIEALQTEISELKRRSTHDASVMEKVIDDRDKTLQFILILRAWIVAGARPPVPALPTHLRDVIPDWVPVDPTEPPPWENRIPQEPTD